MKKNFLTSLKEGFWNFLGILVAILIGTILVAGMIAPYYAISESINAGECPWWVIFLIK